MAQKIGFDYKRETNRYNYYYRRLYVYYQKPIVKVSSAVLFTFAIIIFFAVFAIRPTLLTITELVRKIDDQKQVLEQAKKKSSSLATAQQQLDMLGPNLAVLETAIPADYQTQSLLRDLEAVAGALNLPLSSLRVVDLTYPPPKPTAPDIQEIVFTISINAPYPIFKQYVGQLLQLPRMLSIDTILMSIPEDKTKSLSPDALDNMFKGRAFYLITPGSKP